ncbi:MAG: TolC family protein [Burkholderiaceae bacterium]
MNKSSTRGAPARLLCLPPSTARAWPLLLSLGLSLLPLAGCSAISADGGFGAVERLTEQRIGQRPSYPRTAAQADFAAARVAELLGQTLTADGAVEIALLNNRELQAGYAELGIAEADWVRAGRLANPSLSFGRLGGPGGVEIDRAVLFDVLGLLRLPMTRQLEQTRFEQAQLQAAAATVELAAEARAAFFEAVAAQQLADYQGQVMDAADASSELARRMLAAGNFNRLAHLREQSFQAEASTALARARHRAVAARERLVRLLGLGSEQLRLLQLPARLPDLPAAPAGPGDAEQAAMGQRLDVLMAKRAAQASARSLGLTKATRFVNVLDAGYQNKNQPGERRSNGYVIELELPLFDFGSARAARAEASYMQALHRAAAVGLNAQSEVREAYSAYRSAYDIARRYQDELLPLRKRISEENLLRYNGMLLSVFELLADAREQIAGVIGAVESQRDYWVAETRLQTALAGRWPGTEAAAKAAAAALDH